MSESSYIRCPLPAFLQQDKTIQNFLKDYEWKLYEELSLIGLEKALKEKGVEIISRNLMVDVFNRIDANKNGFITENEFKQFISCEETKEKSRKKMYTKIKTIEYSTVAKQTQLIKTEESKFASSNPIMIQYTSPL